MPRVNRIHRVIFFKQKHVLLVRIFSAIGHGPYFSGKGFWGWGEWQAVNIHGDPCHLLC